MMRKSPTTNIIRSTPASVRPRSDSPRPKTPLGHFRTDIPSISDTEYFNPESDELTDKRERHQQARYDARLQRVRSETAISETAITPSFVPQKQKSSYSIEELTQFFSFKSVKSPQTVTSLCRTNSPSIVANYTPVSTTDSETDEEKVGILHPADTIEKPHQPNPRKVPIRILDNTGTDTKFYNDEMLCKHLRLKGIISSSSPLFPRQVATPVSDIDRTSEPSNAYEN